MLDNKAISQEAILEQLTNLAKNQNESWKSYFEGNAGQIILELLSAVLAEKNFNNLIRIRESGLDTAILESSITELSINKGVYKPSAKSYEINLTFIPQEDFYVSKNDLIGYYLDYGIYSLESKQIEALKESTLKVTIGNLEKFDFVCNENVLYYELNVLTNGKYLCSNIEELYVNSKSCELLTERKPLYYENLNNTALKILDYYGLKIIFGDDVVGKKINFNDKISYKVLTINDTIFDMKFDETKFIFLENKVFLNVSVQIISYPSKYMDKELLRKIALRTSIDGRWVTAKDYEDGIMYLFYYFLDDVWVEDLYPSENVWILPKNDFLTDENKQLMIDMINKRKSTSADLKLKIIDSSKGKNFKFFLTYVGDDDDDTIKNAINIVKKYFLRKIIKQNIFFNSADFAVEVTKLLPKGKVYASSLDEGINLEKGDYLNTLDVFYIKKDS